MCGFFGFITQTDAPDKTSILHNGLEHLAHRGPDDQGAYIASRIALGHRRLAIFDLSPAGRQPMSFQQYKLIFNGAIYNYLALRAELEAYGFQFRSHTDTEVILAAYHHWGENCVSHFNGMWSLVILDESKQQLFCSRDRFGIKPFYYRTSSLFPFACASEIKAFQALTDWKAKANMQRVYEYLAFGWQDHTTDTLFAGIQQLPPAHNLLVDLQNHTFSINSYYKLEERIQQTPTNEWSLQVAKEKVYELLYDSVKLRLQADVNTSLTLSGGIDSTSIAGLARLSLGRTPSIHSFSALFTEPEIDETPYVRAASNQHHIQTHILQPNAAYCWANYDRILRHQDEPFSSAAVPAHFELMEQVQRQGFKVLLNGQGADEIFAGYRRFYGPWWRSLSTGKKLLAIGQIAIQTQFHVNAFHRFFSNHSSTAAIVFAPEFLNYQQSVFQRSKEHDLRSCSINLLQEVGFPVMLHYEDRNAMAFGIEMRCPFLDYRLVELAVSLPDEYKLWRGQRKYILREAMQPVLPKLIFKRRRKLGFATPQNHWMDQHHSAIATEINRMAAIQAPIFQPTFKQWVNHTFRSQHYINYPTLWRLFSFARWIALFEVETTLNDY